MSLRYGHPEAINFTPPAAPLSAATVVLFDSWTMLGKGQLRMMNGTLLEVTYQAMDQDSAANGLIAYTMISTDINAASAYVQNNMKNDAGVDTLPVQVTAAMALRQRTYRFVISPYAEFKLTHTAGVVPPTTWSLGITLHTGNLSVTR